jgi:hypothetical protein
MARSGPGRSPGRSVIPPTPLRLNLGEEVEDSHCDGNVSVTLRTILCPDAEPVVGHLPGPAPTVLLGPLTTDLANQRRRESANGIGS